MVGNGIIIPTDSIIFQRGGEKPPTSFRSKIFENRAGAQSLNLWGQKLFMGIELPLFLYLQTTPSQIPDLHGDGMMGLCQFLVGKSCRIPICSPNIWVNWCPYSSYDPCNIPYNQFFRRKWFGQAIGRSRYPGIREHFGATQWYTELFPKGARRSVCFQTAHGPMVFRVSDSDGIVPVTQMGRKFMPQIHLPRISRISHQFRTSQLTSGWFRNLAPVDEWLSSHYL